MTTETLHCAACGEMTAPDLRERGKHVGAFCGACGKWITWVKQIMTLERARELRLWGGEYSGEKLGDLHIDADRIAYLRRIADGTAAWLSDAYRKGAALILADLER